MLPHLCSRSAQQGLVSFAVVDTSRPQQSGSDSFFRLRAHMHADVVHSCKRCFSLLLGPVSDICRHTAVARKLSCGFQLDSHISEAPHPTKLKIPDLDWSAVGVSTQDPDVTENHTALDIVPHSFAFHCPVPVPVLVSLFLITNVVRNIPPLSVRATLPQVFLIATSSKRSISVFQPMQSCPETVPYHHAEPKSVSVSWLVTPPSRITKTFAHAETF